MEKWYSPSSASVIVALKMSLLPFSEMKWRTEGDWILYGTMSRMYIYPSSPEPSSTVQ